MQGAITLSDSTRTIDGYQLYKFGNIVIFNVTYYKKGTGKISSFRDVCTIPAEFAPATNVYSAFATTGMTSFDSTGNPGHQVRVTNDGKCQIQSNNDTGNYASWSMAWVTS